MKRTVLISSALVTLLALSAVGAWLWSVKANRSASMSYSLEVAYGEVPEDDLELQAWLEAIPGFRTGEVTRAKKKVSLHFELSDPQPPDVLAAFLEECEKLGYRDPAGYSGRFGRKKVFDFHTLRVEYRTLPENDQTLRDWLGKNPGLRSAKVSREGKVIELEFVATDPPVPTLQGDIMRYCKTIGYNDQVGYISGFGPYH